MHTKTTTAFLLALLFWAGCKPKPAAQTTESTTPTTEAYNSCSTPSSEPAPFTPTTTEEPAHFDDGTYCSLVKYYNPTTGTESYYRLNVEVEDGRLVKIQWPNGGWLDESHFDPPRVSENGYCTFTTDRGYQMGIFVKEAGGCTTTTYSNPGTYRSYSVDENAEEIQDEETRLENEYGSYKAEVVKRISGCDHMILERNGDYFVVEWMGRYDPQEGDIIQGNLRSYGTKTCYVPRRERETRLYIEDYSISLDRAWEIIRDKCDLESDEEE